MQQAQKGETMKTIVSSISIKAVIATVLCVTFVIYPALRISSARAAYASVDLKSEAEVRSEATRYDGAMRAIAGVASMKLEKPDEMKRALATLDSKGSDLKFHRSKLIVLGLSDTSFTGAVKKASPNKEAAEALIKETTANPKAVLELNGAQSLVTRLQQSAQTEAATLRRVSERLKEAAAKIKQSSKTRVTPDVREAKLISAVYRGVNESYEPSLSVNPLQGEVIAVLLIVVAVIIFLEIASFAIKVFESFLTKVLESIERQTAECREAADTKRTKCVADAHNQVFPLNLVAEAECDSEWLAQSAACLLKF
jgi:hypothetical protein